VGERLQNLRSALDQMAWACALRFTDDPTHEVSFPIQRDEASWRKAVSTPRIKKAADAIGADAWQVIESLQPHMQHRAPKEDPLWGLNELARIDRHRRLHLTVISTRGHMVTFGPLRQRGNRTMQPDGSIMLATPPYHPAGGSNVSFTGEWKTQHEDDSKTNGVQEHNYLTFIVAFDPEGEAAGGFDVLDTLRGIEFNIRMYVVPLMLNTFSA